MIKLLYASDLHGSTLMFKKLINASLIYKADAVVIGGDITGKGIAPIVKRDGKYETEIYGTRYEAKSGEELKNLINQVTSYGFYEYIVEDPSELEKLDEVLDKVLEELMAKRILEWADFARAKLGESGVKVYMMPGNDDPYTVDAAIEKSGVFINHARRVVELGDYLLFGYDKTNITPWKCPRDVEEDVMRQELSELLSGVRDYSRLIFNAHCPPYGTTLDLAPKLDEDLKPVISGGGIVMEHVGCASIREFIERHQPLLGLHGHIHESRSIEKIGRTTIVNAGSAYNEGILYAALITLDKDRVKGVNLIKG
ncbi:metallophosphoesterase family protein [Infirmifilum sp. NZ]|uniref:metallophosphoesterase family protein n=1 Tax=Infirmifilum sp. NZ TaxID=2926850 RepID=UPI000CAB0347|nr:metallophosphoesterase [Infirmifilum sp. NZ]PLJ78569.1 MAG: hypothetical protein B7L53_01080 [Thermofilum sp. NZ13]UNQ73737.1 metallophosphoesterase [Infirmifilum sp. NZ]